MYDEYELVMKTQKMSTEELNNRTIELFNYFIDLGADCNKILELTTLVNESLIRKVLRNGSA